MTKSGPRPWLLAVYVFLAAGAVIMLAPFFWMLSTSIKADADIFGLTPRWIPTQFNLANYPDAWQAVQMGRLFFNSVLVTVVSVAGQVLFGAMAGYVFARLRFPGNSIIFAALLVTFMVPFEVLIIPIYIAIRTFPFVGGNNLAGQGGSGLLNTYAGLILPNLISIFGVFLFRQFFLAFPREIEEAALVDGASRSRFFWKVLLPNAKPAMATVGLFSFVWVWNDFLWPLVVARDTSMYTLQVGLAQFNQQFGTAWGMLMAGSVMATLPIVVLFLFLQRFLLQGIATTGLKG